MRGSVCALRRAAVSLYVDMPVISRFLIHSWSPAVEAPSASRQGQRSDQSYRMAEQHVAPAHQSPGPQNPVILGEGGEPHWRNLVFRAS
jgi:hypothetical protein